jgi:hypothetical protein
MAKRKNGKPHSSRNSDEAWLKMMYAKTRREFSAADLQKYTEIEEGIPAEQVLADCEAIHRRLVKKKKG